MELNHKEELVYDVYVGFTGIPTTFPFHTKWKIDKAGLTKEEFLEWFEKIALGYYQDVVIKLWNHETLYFIITHVRFYFNNKCTKLCDAGRSEKVLNEQKSMY